MELTNDNNMPKDIAATDSGTIPTLVPELVATFVGGKSDAISNRHHGIGGGTTHLPLALRQARHAGAD